MITTACRPASGPGIAEPEWPPAGQNLRDVALQLRLLLNRGISLAIATVVGAHGTVLRQPGTVLVTSQSGDTIGFDPGGPLDGAIRDLAADALATGRDSLEHLEIEEDAASYIGISGQASLDIHAMRVQAGDPVFASALRHLDSGAATVTVTGTRGISGYAVIGAHRVTGHLGWPELPSPLVEDARSMLGSCRTACRTYGPHGERNGAALQVWMQSYPQEQATAQPGPSLMALHPRIPPARKHPPGPVEAAVVRPMEHGDGDDVPRRIGPHAPDGAYHKPFMTSHPARTER
jgi:hypothetical protein